MHLAVVALIVGLLTSACGFIRIELGAEDEEPSPAEDGTPVTGQPSPLPEEWALCANGEAGFAIGFPADWNTAGDAAEPCSLFSREEIEVEPDTEPPITSMMVNVAEAPFERAVEGLREDGTDVITEEEVELAGHRAVRYELEEIEGRLYPDGTMRYGYVINKEDGALIVETVNTPRSDLPYEENKRIIDRAVQTIRFELA